MFSRVGRPDEHAHTTPVHRPRLPPSERGRFYPIRSWSTALGRCPRRGSGSAKIPMECPRSLLGRAAFERGIGRMSSWVRRRRGRTFQAFGSWRPRVLRNTNSGFGCGLGGGGGGFSPQLGQSSEFSGRAPPQYGHITWLFPWRFRVLDRAGLDRVLHALQSKECGPFHPLLCCRSGRFRTCRRPCRRSHL